MTAIAAAGRTKESAKIVSLVGAGIAAHRSAARRAGREDATRIVGPPSNRPRSFPSGKISLHRRPGIYRPQLSQRVRSDVSQEAMMAAQSDKSQAKNRPGQNGGTPNVLPRPDFHFPGEVGRTYVESDPAQFPKPVQAPRGAPNILLILIDDCGFGQFGTFGGGIPSPTMDKLAAEGLRYNHFHTTALCSPTRAALITGRNHHSTSFAGITEAATGYDGYTCILPRSCGTVGEVLRQNGYMTAWIGKNHNTPTWETSAAGPFDH
jgi:hypothetical protein